MQKAKRTLIAVLIALVLLTAGKGALWLYGKRKFAEGAAVGNTAGRQAEADAQIQKMEESNDGAALYRDIIERSERVKER